MTTTVTPRLALMPLRQALVLLALGALLAAAAPARAAAPGINIAHVESARGQVVRATQTGARYARLFVLWSDFQPAGPRQSIAGYRLTQYDDAVARLRRAGARPIFSVVGAPRWANGSADRLVPPSDPAAYARFLGALARHFRGRVAAYEVWNEEDDAFFWHARVDARRYAALLRSGFAAVRRADRRAKVLVGPLTGNNFAYLGALYRAGIKGHFDAVAVHTDTACLDRGPQSFYRDSRGRVARFTFLGYRTVHAVMRAHGDGRKPIWMTELGWSSTGGGICASGTWAGQKPAGVSAEAQAANLRAAFHCLARDRYVQVAAWFTLQDDPAQSPEEARHYGLLDAAGAPKPAWAAFRDVVTRGDSLRGPCGDFRGPRLRVRAPVRGQRVTGVLRIVAAASDGSGLDRIRLFADGRRIKSFSVGLADGRPVRLDWTGARRLRRGRHAIRVVAFDRIGNRSSRTIGVVRADARRLSPTLPSHTIVSAVRCSGRACVLGGRVRGPALFATDGRVRIEWQRRVDGRWRVALRNFRTAWRPFAVLRELNHGGRWRVRAVFEGQAPLRSSATAYQAFRVP
ncbi:MAG TPA: Ig-like domain-containing protein [Solirubrobacteraceae bacterium]|nr:Ig-like domain-containing protein [Solirubrobacteraceae bacterium]